MRGKSEHSSSKKAALKELRDSFAKGEMSPMHKVSIMAKDKKGLKEGLEKAKDVLGKMKYEEGGAVGHGGAKQKAYEDGGYEESEKEHDYEKLESMSKEELLDYIKKCI